MWDDLRPHILKVKGHLALHEKEGRKGHLALPKEKQKIKKKKKKKMIRRGRKRPNASLFCTLWGLSTKFMIYEDLTVQTQIRLW
jgi:hypothetical protein